MLAEQLARPLERALWAWFGLVAVVSGAGGAVLGALAWAAWH